MNFEEKLSGEEEFAAVKSQRLRGKVQTSRRTFGNARELISHPGGVRCG